MIGSFASLLGEIQHIAHNQHKLRLGVSAARQGERWQQGDKRSSAARQIGCNVVMQV